jgi:hypothetical protein
MGLFGGSSKSSNTSNSYEYLYDDDQAADGESVVTRAGGDVLIQQTSGEAVALGEAFADAVNEVADKAIGLGDEAVYQGFGFGSDALDATTKATGEAFDFAGDTSRDAFDFAGDAQNNAFGFAYDALTRSNDQFADSAKVAQGGLDLAGDALGQAIGFSEDALSQVSQFGGDAFDFAQGAMDRALDGIEETQDTAFDFAQGARDDAYKFATQSLDQLSGAFSSTLAASQEDSAELSSQLIKIGVPAIALILIAQVLK